MALYKLIPLLLMAHPLAIGAWLSTRTNLFRTRTLALVALYFAVAHVGLALLLGHFPEWVDPRLD